MGEDIIAAAGRNGTRYTQVPRVRRFDTAAA